jgi:catechol 2,3-dioxygenase-like lactoylglutathione lyase family enzyme
MKLSSLLAGILMWSVVGLGQARPKITGIDHVDFYTTSPEANKNLYVDIFRLPFADPIEAGQTQRFIVGMQWVGYSPAPDPGSTNRMDHVAFRTENCEALRRYLAANGTQVPGSLTHLKNGSPSFSVTDPEDHKIEFVQSERDGGGDGGKAISSHMIHVGFVVHDRAAEDHFYKDILGFHMYWHGGMTADRDDWVAMQVPDGTDWLEYMLNIKPDADLRTTGVMNHISLGVKDMKQTAAKVDAAIAQLPSTSRPRKDDEPKIGRDGKWQYNIYDPDQTRIELMEFTPVEKPCCSEFQGRHPSE